MGENTGIEWTDATWNPTTGCDRVSPGCDHCYAMTLALRLKAMGSAHYQRDGDPETSGPGFGFTEHPDGLDKPLRWTRPRRIFVNSMSDLFHESATRAHVIDVFAVMALARQHTFQLLTKRPAKMRSWLSSPSFQPLVRDAAYLMMTGEHPSGVKVPRALADAYGGLSVNVTRDQRPWPLKNVWVGTSVEDQKRADLRIPALLDTPAAVRFLSCEPLLGPVSLFANSRIDNGTLVDWVIVGGESGPGSRPMHPAWAQMLRNECVEHGIAFLFKQWGEWVPEYANLHRDNDRSAFIDINGWVRELVAGKPESAPYARGIDITMRRSGKHRAGRQLDRRTWDEFPQAVFA